MTGHLFTRRAEFVGGSTIDRLAVLVGGGGLRRFIA